MKQFLTHFQNVILTEKRLGSNSNIYYYGGKSLNIITRLKLELGHLHKSSKPFKYNRHYLILYYPSVPLKQPSINSFIYISSHPLTLLYIHPVHTHVLKVNRESPGASSYWYWGSEPGRICSKKLEMWTKMLTKF